MATAANHNRGNNFDTLRLGGALLVVASHQFATAGRAEPRVGGGIPLGTLGVLLFFSLSGFLVARSWQHDPNLVRFLARRFLRIWPGLAAVVLITLGLSYALLPAVSRPPELYRYLQNLVFDRIEFPVFGRSANPMLNASLWTITFEVRWYLILAAAAFLLKGALRWALAAAAAVGLVWFCGAGAQAGLDRTAAAGAVPYVAYFGAFFVGGCLQAYFDDLRRPALALALAAGGIGLIVVGQGYLGWAVLLPPLAVLVGSRSWPVLRSAGRLGDFSYGIYLWAWPVEQVVTRWLGPGRSYGSLLLTSLGLILPLAFLSWHAVERPCLRLKPRAAHTVR